MEQYKSKKDGPVLLCIDESTHAERAFRWYAKHGYREDHQLLLVYCTQDQADPSSNTAHTVMVGAILNAEVWGRLQAKAVQNIKHVHDKYVALLKEHGMEGCVRIVHGDPGPTLAQTARDEKCSHVILGTRGMSQLRTTLLGSKSNYILHHVNCPVTICRPAEDEVI